MDRKALITGSTKGIGRAIGLELLASGCMVVFNYAKDEAAARQLKDELDNLGYQERYQIVQTDLSCVEGCDSLLQKLEIRFDQLDYLVLNAGATWYGGLKEIEVDKWEEILRINLTVPFFLVQKCADRMCPNGCILFLGAVMGQFPHARSIPYGTSKAGVHYLAKALVKEFAAKQVRVNCLCPGFVERSEERRVGKEC